MSSSDRDLGQNGPTALTADERELIQAQIDRDLERLSQGLELEGLTLTAEDLRRLANS